jgi:hypothetical protein
MMDQRLPFAEIEVACNTCGRVVLQARRRVGRHARFCSAECKRKAKKVWNARWRENNRDYAREAYLRRKAGGGSKVGEASAAEPALPSFADFFPAKQNFEACNRVYGQAEDNQTLAVHGFPVTLFEHRRPFLGYFFRAAL